MVAVQDRRRLAPARWPGDVPRLRGFGAAGDPLLWTPWAIQAEVDKTGTYIDLLNSDIMYDKSPERADFRAAWEAFYGEWKTWYISGWSMWWGSSVAQAREFGRRAEEYRTRFVATGGAPTRTTEHVAPPAPPEPPPAWLTALKWGTVALGIGGTIYMVARFVPRGKAKKPKEAAA